ncbi:hypothetical protein J2S78_000265 [Salibacterium salarium]|uniref:hypothetical protein n=1 Tax=Salibacterium salarium TaxID=284579 RepID=UPI0027870ABD|nr:hypothetical protein [Salibacterium salarium]MDQ0297857.1 hypothetical protein [Salibacterium salarium]
MKSCYIGIGILLLVTLIGSMLGTSDDIVEPVIGSVITSLIFLGLIKWEGKPE